MNYSPDNQRQLQLTIALRLNMIQRQSLPQLTYTQIEETLLKWKWKNRRPTSLHEAVNDVLSLSADEIVAYLSTQAVVEGQKKSISEFEDLIGG